MPSELDNPVVLDFPLRGEWLAVTSPADRVPSHGTNILGQRYAYDFLRVDRPEGGRVHPAGMLKALTIGYRTREVYGWGEPVLLPFDSEIVAAEDGYPERGRIVPLLDALRALKAGLTFKPGDDTRPLLGNYVIARSGDIFAGFAHLAPGSIAARAGEELPGGHRIGRVGHTGNSTSPHLHFQLMDGPDLRTAKGIACAFRGLEVERDGHWVPEDVVAPGKTMRVRSGLTRPG